MKYTILNLYEAATVLLPFIVLFLLEKRRCGWQEKPRRHILYMTILAFYLFFTFHITGAGTLFDILRYRLDIRIEQINLLPFSDPNLSRVFCVLNVLLFVPLGFLLPLRWPRWRTPLTLCCTGLLFSLLIETSQLLNNRRTDIDDLILNTLGAVAGLCTFYLFQRIHKTTDDTNISQKYSPILYIFIPFLCRFLLFNEFGAAKLLFGF